MSHSILSSDTFDHNHSGAKAHALGFVGFVRKALAIRRQRRALMALDDRMLSDIGLSQSDAYRESHRSFFDLESRRPTRR